LESNVSQVDFYSSKTSSEWLINKSKSTAVTWFAQVKNSQQNGGKFIFVKAKRMATMAK